MADSEKVIIELDFKVDKNGISRAKSKVQNEFSSAGDKAGKDFSKNFTANLKDIAKSAFSVKGALISLGATIATVFSGKILIQAASRQEDAINSLNSSLIATGKFSQDASKRLQDYASSLQSVTRFGDEAILETQALIQSLGNLSEQGLKDATAATLDLAAALRIDLKSAAVLVGKAAAGEVGSFSRYGVIVKKAGDNATTFANALTALNSKFGGAASRDVFTFSGATDQLSNSFGDLLEDLGFLITNVPAIQKLFKALGGEIEIIRGNLESVDLSNFITGFIQSALTFAQVINVALIRPIRILFNTVSLVFNGIQLAFASLVSTIGQLLRPISAISSALGLKGASKALDAFTSGSLASFGEQLQDIKTDASDLFDDSIGESITRVAEQVAMANNSIATNLEETTPIIAENLSIWSQSFDSFLEGWNANVTEWSGSLDQMKARLASLAKESKKLMVSGFAGAAAQGFAAFGAALVKGENALKAFTKAFIASIGQSLIQLGTKAILEGLYYTLNPVTAASGVGPALIGAGAAMAAAGGAMSALGGGATVGGGAGAVGTSPTDVGGTSTQTAQLEPEAVEAGSSIVINVDRIVDPETEGARLVELINQASDSNNVTIRRNAIA
jgi:hypothetical protein